MNKLLSVLAAVTVAQVGLAENIVVAPAEGGAGIARALEKARAIHRTDANAVVTIELAAGEYLLDKPVEFGTEDGNLFVKGKGAVLQCGRKLGAFRAWRGARDGQDARRPSGAGLTSAGPTGVSPVGAEGARDGQDARRPRNCETGIVV